MEQTNTSENVTKEWLAEQFGKIEKQLQCLETKDKEEYKLLSRKDAADFLKIDLSTLWAWQNKGIVRAYSIGGRVYFLRNELISLLKEVVVNSK